MQIKNVEDIYPLSPTQQGMLFHTLYAQEAGIYCVQFGITFGAALDVAAWRAAWEAVVARHPILRSAFIWEGQEEPLQVVRQQVTLTWDEQNWQGLTAEEQATRLADFLATDRARGFTLAKAPLMRMTLLRLAPDKLHFIWSYHHLLLDGTSNGLVIDEVLASYAAIAAGQTPALPALRPYREYIAWVQEQDLAAAEAFWRQHLAGFTTATPLTVGKLAPTTDATAQNGELETSVSRDLTDALQRFARQHQLTLNTVLQGAWALVLSRYSGEEDVVYGITASTRPPALPGAEAMVGLFINTVPLRVAVPQSERVLPWLKSVQAAQVETRQFDYSPLVQVQGWSAVARGQPLFESLMVFENYVVATQQTNGASALPPLSMWWGAEQAIYPLTLTVAPNAELTLRLNYETQRFDHATIERLAGHLRQVLAGIIADPDRRLADIALITDAERQQVLVDWNATGTNYPRDATIQALFEGCAAATPDTIAVVYADAQLSYAELNRRANQLAHHLRGLGVGPDVAVGVSLDRSLELIISLVGIVKAGGIYVPFDPTYPPERIAFMVDDARMAVLLTRADLQAQLPPSDVPRVLIDQDWPQIAGQPTTNPQAGTLPQHVAYVNYTSGSTGLPKGVQTPHQAVVRLVRGNTFARLTADEVFLQFATVSFDAATLEVWGPLLNSGRLVVYPAANLALDELSRVLVRYGVTTLWLTAGLFHAMVDEQLAGLRNVRQLLAGGDVLSVPHVVKVLQTYPGNTLINGYGPTEGTTFTCCYPMTDPAQVGATVAIGKPIANTQIFILDGAQQPVPVGVPGELHIGGAGLARGYLRRPELTAERFVPHPFSAEPGARLYRTGDLVRWLPDGNVEFMGRIDQQVKLRGYRVEPGEIEALLVSHPDIQAAAVIVWQAPDSRDQRLVAYVVFRPGTALSSNELYDFLKQKLPIYMVPAAFVELPALPLSATGKVDRSALPPPDDAGTLVTKTYVAPRNRVEEELAQIWVEVLHVPQVGVEDNFFELGGHSLLATQVTSRIRDHFATEMPVWAIFEAQTVALLALAIIDKKIADADSATLAQAFGAVSD